MYHNRFNIASARRKLRWAKLWRKQDKIDQAQKKLSEELLFSNCEQFTTWLLDGHNFEVLLSDENKVMRVGGILMPYNEISACFVTDHVETRYQSKTKTKGVLTRFVIGEMVAGDVGGLIGAATADTVTEINAYERKYHYFNILLKDGRCYYWPFEGNYIFKKKLPKFWSKLIGRIQGIIDAQ